MKRDVIVIGGGVMGRSIALRAALSGASVGLVDAGAQIPAATIAAAGMLAPSFERPEAPLMRALFELHRRALKAWTDFDILLREYDSSGVDLRLNGIIGLAQSEDETRLQSKQCDAARRAGLNCELIDENVLKALEPEIGDCRFGAIFSGEEGQVDPLLVMRVLARACDIAGVTTASEAAVSQVEASGGMWRIVLSDGRVFEAQYVVMATGARTIDTPGRPPLVPVKGEALSLASSAIVHVIRTQHAYLCPKSDGRLVIGATERAGESDLTPDLAEIIALRSRAEIVVPGLRAAREISHWAGIRPGTPDGAPILGAAPDWPGLFYALGGYRNGVLQAPLVSRMLVDLMISNKCDSALETFSARRFQAASTRN